jgi:regulator of sigma E protease
MEFFIAIVLLSILILVHELGHFFTARRAEILVEEFGIGLPPRLAGIKRNGTIYSLNALPFGGFVRIHGESGVESPELDHPRAFFAKPIHVRFAVLAAGVALNFLLGVAILAVLFTIGTPVAATPKNAATLHDLHIELIAVAANSPAASAGLKIGDRLTGIVAADEELSSDTLTVDQVRQFVVRHAGTEIKIAVERNGRELVISAVPRALPPAGEGPLGIAMAEVGMQRYPWYRSIIEAVRAAFMIAGNTFAALYFILRDLLMGGKISPSVAGPVGIVQMAGEAARLGALRLANFAAILTINLAVLNVLPIPALDGGRILFLAIERARGKPISRKVEQVLQQAGMAVLIGLILLITIYDIRRL